MKIAVTSSGNGLDSSIDPRFGRCQWFVISDTETKEFEAIENPNIAIGGGAGIQSAQLMSEKGVEAVMTGNCGPNAFRVFDTAKIKIIVGVTGTVREAIDGFIAGKYSIAGNANVESHFGVNPQLTINDIKKGGIMPRGQGMGRGRGMGMGGGMGRGGGMGGGMGRGRGTGDPFPLNEPRNQPNIPVIIAKVDEVACTGCGLCARVCHQEAITIINALAQIDRTRCTGCGQCVAECPNRAISLVKA